MRKPICEKPLWLISPETVQKCSRCGNALQNQDNCYDLLWKNLSADLSIWQKPHGQNRFRSSDNQQDQYYSSMQLDFGFRQNSHSRNRFLSSDLSMITTVEGWPFLHGRNRLRCTDNQQDQYYSSMQLKLGFWQGTHGRNRFLWSLAYDDYSRKHVNFYTAETDFWSRASVRAHMAKTDFWSRTSDRAHTAETDFQNRPRVW